VRLVLTANGPGEVAGWVRPLLHRLYERAPESDVHLFIVPDDYATGAEAQTARAAFPQAHVYDPKRYVAVALGASGADLRKGVDVVQYLGGDLMHAARLHRRFGGIATTYKFTRPAYRRLFARAFAVDERNAERLRAYGTPPERITVVGNLAIDGALIEAGAEVEPGAPRDGILIMPGSRGYEIEHLVPFFFTMALRMLRERPDLPIAFGVSPFTTNAQLRTAIERGGDPRVWSKRGRLVEEGDRTYLVSLDESVRIPVLRHALAAARTARFVVTLPGTKCIELAALGVPMIAITPLNAAELVTFNGPLTYLDRIPGVGRFLKRAVAVSISRKHALHTQPNIDLGEMVVHELHGTLTPGRVARVALARYEDRAWLQESAARLKPLYAKHAGAADRMVTSLLELTGT
jgi:lipid-A-disaccharide synthase